MDSDTIFAIYYLVSVVVIWCVSLACLTNMKKYEFLRKNKDDIVFVHILAAFNAIVGGGIWPFALAYYFLSKVVISVGRVFIKQKEE